MRRHFQTETDNLIIVDVTTKMQLKYGKYLVNGEKAEYLLYGVFVLLIFTNSPFYYLPNTYHISISWSEHKY